MKTDNEALNYPGGSQDFYAKSYGNHDFLSTAASFLNPEDGANSLHFFGYCLVDNSGKQFACLYEQCQDFCSCVHRSLHEENRNFHPLHFHAGDRLRWCNEVLPDMHKFMYSVAVEDFSEYRFAFNHRYLHKDGSSSQFLHEGTLSFTDETCLPVLNLKIFTEIGDIKSDDTMVLTLYRYSQDDGYKKVFTKVYGDTLNGQLSHREKEIVKLSFEGLSSKMIANKLNLSIHTVKNHKRNSMEKTLTHNISELISVCIRSRWL